MAKTHDCFSPHVSGHSQNITPVGVHAGTIWFRIKLT